jgi:uncharacterized coiled-coil DUF342 family protein
MSAIDRELQSLRDQRNRLLNECREWVERRNTLNSELKQLSEKVRALRSERDSMNAEVKSLKASRDRMREEIADRRSKMAEALRPLREGREVRGSFRKTKRSFEDLEWRLQTSSLKLEEENKLVAQIKELEIQLAQHQKLNELKSEIRSQKSALEALRHEAQSIHERLLAAAQSSAKVHEEMMQSVKKLKEAKVAADDAHRRFLQARSELEEVEQKILNNVLEKKKIRREMFGGEEAERQRKGKARVERLAESGSVKLSRGKKVSLEEFKALMEQKKIFPAGVEQSPV